MDAKPQAQDFHLRSGQVTQTDFLKSETTTYPYVRSDEFEAIELTCWEATILFVLPPPGADISRLEGALAKNPDLVEPFLPYHAGDVQMSVSHFVYETDMRDALQKLGVHLIFSGNNTLLSMAPNRSGGILRRSSPKNGNHRGRRWNPRRLRYDFRRRVRRNHDGS